jgi:hypothetical protein
MGLCFESNRTAFRRLLIALALLCALVMGLSLVLVTLELPREKADQKSELHNHRLLQTKIFGV